MDIMVQYFRLENHEFTTIVRYALTVIISNTKFLRILEMTKAKVRRISIINVRLYTLINFISTGMVN